jgi:hypothetical protein
MALAAVALVTVLAPKGHPPSRLVPSRQPDDPATSYLYVSSGELADNAGAGAMLVQGDPALAAGDFHSLAELAVESADAQQIVELGWTVDPTTNGDEEPRLFVFHWIDGNPTCYDACGWVQVSTSLHPGSRVAAGETHAFEIAQVGGNWVMSYDGDELGYFPGALWTTPYTAGGLVQWFGEVAAAATTTCTQMGDGARGADANAVMFSAAYTLDASGAHVAAALGTDLTITDANAFTMGQQSATGFAFGGPGNGGTSCCTPSSCAAAPAACGAPDDHCGATVACGTCDDGQACNPDFTCPGPVASSESPPPTSGGGCCDGGGGGGTFGTLLALALWSVPLNRRRSTRSELEQITVHAASVQYRDIGRVIGRPPR